MTAVALGAAAAVVALVAVGHATRQLRLERPFPAHRISEVPWSWLAAAGLGALLAPPLAAGLLLLPWIRRVVRRRHRRATRARQVATGLVDLTDLLLLATSAGLALPVAHAAVAGVLPPPLGPALAGADRATSLGRPRAEAIADALAPLGARARALGLLLADHLRYGVPLVPALERAALELRLDRRRQAEVEARRVPVRLLAPLVTCILPAFALLTVVPLLAGSLAALPT